MVMVMQFRTVPMPHPAAPYRHLAVALAPGVDRPDVALSRARTLSIWAGTTLASFAAVLLYAFVLTRLDVPGSALELSAVLAASTLSSIVGFAFSPVCSTLLLPMINNPVTLVEILMVCSIPMQALNTAALWRDIRINDLSAFLIGGVLGLPIGIWLLLHLGHGGFKQVIGMLLTVYVGYALLGRPFRMVPKGRLADACIGLAGGLTGGLAAFPSGALVIWCSLQGWDKRRQRALYQPFILVLQIFGLALIHLIGGHGTVAHGLHPAQLVFAPVAALGAFCGIRIFHQLSDRWFARAVNVLLLASGIGLLLL